MSDDLSYQLTPRLNAWRVIMEERPAFSPEEAMAQANAVVNLAPRPEFPYLDAWKVIMQERPGTSPNVAMAQAVALMDAAPADQFLNRYNTWLGIMRTRADTSPEEAMTRASAVVDAAISAVLRSTAHSSSAPASSSDQSELPG